MWKLLLLSLALIQIIEGRTNEDVINDFEPIFQERDEAFTNLKNFTESLMKPRFTQFKEIVTEQGELIRLLEYPESVNRTYNNISEYIKVLELEDYPELTKGCMDYLNQTIEYTRVAVTAQGRSCTSLTLYHFDLLYLFNYTDFMTKLDNEHTILNVTRTECVKQSTPLEVQTCIINDLYTFYVPYLKDVTEYLQRLTEDWSTRLDKFRMDFLYPCYNLLKEDIKVFESNNIDSTKLCLWAIEKPIINVKQ